MGRTIPEERVKLLLSTFKNFDSDGDGFLSPKELVAAGTVLGMNQSEEEMLRQIALVDRNGDGCLSLIEFTELMGHADVIQDYQSFFKVALPSLSFLQGPFPSLPLTTHVHVIEGD